MKTQKYGSTFVSNYSTSALIVKISVLGCRWPGWKWIASWKNEATVFKFIASVSENSLKFWLWFIFSCKFTWYLPFSVLSVFCVRQRYVVLIWGHFDPLGKTWKSPWRSPCKSSYFGKNDYFYQLFLKKGSTFGQNTQLWVVFCQNGNGFHSLEKTLQFWAAFLGKKIDAIGNIFSWKFTSAFLKRLCHHF